MSGQTQTQTVVSSVPAQAAVPEDPAKTEPPAPSTRRKPWWRRRWFGWTIAATITIVLVLVMFAAINAASGSSASNHPRNRGRTGAGALAALIQNEGVRVDLINSQAGLTPSAIQGNSVTVTNTELLTAEQYRLILNAHPTRLILVGPNQTTLTRLSLPVQTSFAHSASLLPGCTEPMAVKAGDVLTPSPGVLYRSASAEQACYPDPADPSRGAAYVRLRLDGIPVIVVAPLFQNQDLAERGNAAFSMMLLGQDRVLTWFVPPPPKSGKVNPDDPAPPPLLPPWLWLAFAQALIALVVVAVWRGRRLGPIISERLPVVIRASETVEGHGRWYHRIKASDTAAVHLRRGSIRRLARLFGSADPDRLADLLADRTGRSRAEIRAALCGPPPADGQALLDLKIYLDHLEQEARNP